MIPKEKFYLETYGCKLNQADSDLIRGVLTKDFRETSEKEADVVVINSCGVIEKTERKILTRIKELKRKRKRVILTGCLPLISPKIHKIVDGVVSPTAILQIDKVVKEVLKGKQSIKISTRKIDKSRYCRLKKRTNNSCVAIVPIAEGCLGNCTYCATKLARGKLKSFSQRHILQEIELVLSLGFKEIHLTSQDLGCFGLDRKKLELPELLQKIIQIPGDFRVRLGMANPQYVKKILKPLIKCLKSEKIYTYLHIPVQSGSNTILKLMKRGYEVKDFENIVKELRKHFKDIMIVTDIIVGFPYETEKDFQQSIGLIQKIRPSIVNITKYSARPGTEASQFKDFPDRIKTERSRILNKICDDIKRKEQKKFLNKEFKALIAQAGKNNTLIARLPNFKAVILKEGKIGEFTKVRITDFEINYLIGKILH